MILGIDASNLRGGGTVTHLIELLRHAAPNESGFERVDVWAGNRTLCQLPRRPWLETRHDDLLDRSLPHRVRWQRFTLPSLSESAAYDVLFAPGGTCTGRFRPVVTMSQNMLPFHLREVLRYGARWMLLRNVLLRLAQSNSFKTADGVIFLNEFARHSAQRVTGPLRGRVAVIPHGIPSVFHFPPRLQKPITSYDHDRPYRILYVSTVDEYKHQWNVVRAVGELRKEGMPVVLDLVGGAYEPSHKRLQKVLERIDPTTLFVGYHGFVPYDELPQWYVRSDLFVFASTCENQPLALLEAMAAGLPIACSAGRPMSDMLGADSPLFNPVFPREIARAIKTLVLNVDLRTRCASDAFARSAEFTWEAAAARIFGFLAEVALAAK